MSENIGLDEIRKYGGCHAALVDGKIISASKDPAEAYNEAKRKHPGKRVVLTYIPTEDALIL